MMLEQDHSTAPVTDATGNHDILEPDADARPLTVLQVLPALQSQGELEYTVLNVAAALAVTGSRSIVASAGGPFVHTLTRAGTRHLTLPLDSGNPLTMYTNGGQLADLIQQENVDLVHAFAPGPAWSAWWAARRTGRAFLTSFRNPSAPSRKIWKRYAEVMTWGQPVIAISRFVAGHLNRVYGVPPANIRIVYPGIDIDRFGPFGVSADRIVAMAQRWRLLDGHPVIMVPGDLVPGRGFEVLFEAIKQLGRQDVCCLIVATGNEDGGYRQTIEGLAAGRGLGGAVRLVDRCEDMPAAYMLADVVVCPSTEPLAFNLHLVEAQALGRPVIGADHGGVREAIVADRTGWLTPPGDAGALAEAINSALSLSLENRASLGEAARAHVTDYFSKEAMCGRTLQIYHEVLGSRRGA